MMDLKPQNADVLICLHKDWYQEVFKRLAELEDFLDVNTDVDDDEEYRLTALVNAARNKCAELIAERSKR